MKKVQVKATSVGFDGFLLRQPGDTFDVSEALARKHSSWFKPVDPKFVVTPRAEPKQPATVNDELEDLKAQVAQLTALLTGKVKGKGKAGEKADTEPAGESLV